MRARQVYDQSNGDQTRAYYRQLVQMGPIGVIAMNLFRAHKASTRAKQYRGRAIHQAYDKKDYSLDQLLQILTQHGDALRIRFGWLYDAKAINFEHTLYVDLPTGQVSFHTHARGTGPDYSGEWDGAKLSAQRIIAWCDRLHGLEIQEQTVLVPMEAAHADRQAAEYAWQQTELFA